MATDRAAFAAMLDHTLLRPEATAAQVRQLGEQAAEHGFACAMVNGAWVAEVAAVLAGTGVRVGTVLGFPLGASLPATKAAEADQLARLGARDLDMVLSIGYVRSGRLREASDDVRGVVEVARAHGAIVKVILETCLLTEEEKRTAGTLALEAGADFLKTSTGFGAGGATVADVALLRAVAGPGPGVKASGGIRTLADARAMLAAGATRLGTSASVALLAELAD